MAPPRSLLSLNQDVLREILAHLLLDTTLERNRAAVLQTCTLLYELGLPLLYRVVDLRGFRSGHNMLEHWRRLFGEGGSLIEGGGRDELARTVKELRLGGELDRYQEEYDEDLEDEIAADAATIFTLQKVTLPSCSHLLLDLRHLDGLHVLQPLITRLPVEHLQIQLSCEPFGPFEPSDTIRTLRLMASTTLTSILFGPYPSRCPWKDLHTVVFLQYLLYEKPGPISHTGPYTLSSSDWSFKVLAFELPPCPFSAYGSSHAFNQHLRPNCGEQDRFLAVTERIELRTSGPDAGTFEEELRKAVAEKPLDASHRRIFDLVVFVGEDGKEKRLMEGSV